MACNIVHELAHVFELKFAQTNCGKSVATCETFEDLKTLADPRFAAGTTEALWGNSNWAEAGARWEWITFGGRVHPLQGRIDTARGMAVFNGDGVAGVKTPAGSNVDNVTGYCVQMSFMEEVQQQSFSARPVRTLRIPQGPVRAYGYPELALMEFKEYLSYRDAELAAEADKFTDPADIALMGLLADALAQEPTTEAVERPSKVRKVDNLTSSKPGLSGTRPIKGLPKRGRLGQRLGQPLIRRYMSKTDADAKVMRQEAMANATRQEQEGARGAAIERAAAEDARRYHAPAPGQKELHDYFLFEGENPYDEIPTPGFIDEYVDPATERPEDLTMADKWMIAEEYICLIMGWELVQFLAQGQDQPQWRPLDPFDLDAPSSFTQEALNALLSLRANYPGRSWPERRAMEIAQYEQKREIASRMGMMDELWTLLGYSRILCNELLTKTGAGALGIGCELAGVYADVGCGEVDAEDSGDERLQAGRWEGTGCVRRSGRGLDC
jgi:hypothetical protein